MRRLCLWMLVASSVLAVRPARAAVDLLQRLEEKGIITAEERQELAPERATVRPGKNGFGLSWASADGRFAATLNGYGQVRYTFQDKDNAVNVSDFAVQRVRLGRKGHTFRKDLKYALSLDVYSGKGDPTVLEQYWVDYAPLAQAPLRGPEEHEGGAVRALRSPNRRNG